MGRPARKEHTPDSALRQFRASLAQTNAFDVHAPTHAQVRHVSNTAARLMRARDDIALLIELLDMRFKNQQSVSLDRIKDCHAKVIRLLESEPLAVYDEDNH